MKRHFVAALALALSATGAPALAAEPTPTSLDEARTHFQNGRKLYESGRSAEALVELRASEERMSSPNTTLLIAQALQQKGDRVAALGVYERAKREAELRVQTGETRFRPTMDEAAASIAALHRELGEIIVRAPEVPAGATLLLDGKPLDDTAGGRALELRAWHEPSPATIDLRAPGREDAHVIAAVRAGTTVEIALVLPAAAPRATTPPASRSPSSPPPATIVAAGVGVTGFALFGVFGAMSLSARDALAGCAGSCPRSVENLDRISRGKTDQIVANVSITVGGVALATAGALWILRPRSVPSLALGIAPGGATITGKF